MFLRRLESQDIHKIKGQTIFYHVEENTGVNRTGEFAETTEKETENKNIYTNIPLTMHESEKNGDNEYCWNEANFLSDFAVKPATKNKLFKDRCENNE